VRSARSADFPVDEVARRARLRDESLEPMHVLWAFIDVLVDRYLDVCDAVDERIDRTEDIVFDDQPEVGIPHELFELRRDLGAFRRQIGPLREVLGEVIRSGYDLERDDLLALQDAHDRLLRVLDLVESQRDLLTGLLEAELAVASNRMNQVMKMMTSWGAILLGATLIAGIYGMNFKHMPELNSRYGYPLALLSMALMTVVLYTYFKRKKYL
jgi:magnesium transporter